MKKLQYKIKKLIKISNLFIIYMKENVFAIKIIKVVK